MWPEQNSPRLRVRRREVMMGRRKKREKKRREKTKRKWVCERKDSSCTVGVVNEFCIIRIVKLPHYRCITSLWRDVLQNKRGKENIKQRCGTVLRLIKTLRTCTHMHAHSSGKSASRLSQCLNVSCFLKLVPRWPNTHRATVRAARQASRCTCAHSSAQSALKHWPSEWDRQHGPVAVEDEDEKALTHSLPVHSRKSWRTKGLRAFLGFYWEHTFPVQQ